MKVMCLAGCLKHNQGLSNAGSPQHCYSVIITFIFNNNHLGRGREDRYLTLEQNFFPVTSYITSLHLELANYFMTLRRKIQDFN